MELKKMTGGHMNPKKQIFEYIKNYHDKNNKSIDPDEDSKWRELFDGMSSGTARIVIDREAGENLPADYKVDLKNEGRYYVAAIVGHQGKILQRLLVDKQTGDVKLIS